MSVSEIVVSAVCGVLWAGVLASWMRVAANHRLKLFAATWLTIRAVLASRSKSRLYALMALVSLIPSTAITVLPAPFDVPTTLYLVSWTLPLLLSTVAFAPPSVLILGSSQSPRSTRLIARLQDELGGIRSICFLKIPSNHSWHGQGLLASFTPSSSVWGDFVHITHSITDNHDWTKIVFSLMRMVPVIVVDVREQTEGLTQELQVIQKSRELGWKTIFVGDVASRRSRYHVELFSGTLHQGRFAESDVKAEVEHRLPPLQVLRFSGWLGQIWDSWPLRISVGMMPVILACACPFLLISHCEHYREVDVEPQTVDINDHPPTAQSGHGPEHFASGSGFANFEESGTISGTHSGPDSGTTSDPIAQPPTEVPDQKPRGIPESGRIQANRGSTTAKPESDASTRLTRLNPESLGAIGGGVFIFSIVLLWFSTATLKSTGHSIVDAHQREQLRNRLPVSWLQREQHRDADPAYKSMVLISIGLLCMCTSFVMSAVALVWYLVK